MKNILMAWVALLSGVLAADIYAAPGEYWEITSKMDMPGMPFAMPATTVKVCIPPGGEKDPRRTQDKKSNCEMTDVKTSGNKVSYKGKCVEKDGTMNMEGENTYEHDSYHGIMHMTGKSHGHDMDMKTSYSGKRLGGSCDTEELVKKVQAQEKEIKGKLCDTAKSDTSDLINRAGLLLNNESCPGKKELLCDAVRKDAPRDADVYQTLISTEKNNGNLVTKACGLNMDATTKALCKNLNGKNYRKLTAYCPAEAKAYMATARKKECEGRSYTAHEDLSKCLNGQDGGDNADEGNAGDSSSKGETGKKSGSNNSTQSVIDGAKKLNGESVLDGAKKLKGLFGF